jgi:hypothetical protein
LAIRRLLRCTGTEISREKYFPANFHGVQSYDTPRLRARGGSWEERNPKTKVQVKDMIKVKVKAKVVWNFLPPPRIDPAFFPKWDERFSGDERKKNVARSKNL